MLAVLVRHRHRLLRVMADHPVDWARRLTPTVAMRRRVLGFLGALEHEGYVIFDGRYRVTAAGHSFLEGCRETDPA